MLDLCACFNVREFASLVLLGGSLIVHDIVVYNNLQNNMLSLKMGETQTLGL